MNQVTIFDTLSSITGPNIMEVSDINGGPAIRITEEKACRAKEILSGGIELNPTETDCAEAYGIMMMAWILGMPNCITYTGASITKNKRNIRLEMPYKMDYRGIEFEVVR